MSKILRKAETYLSQKDATMKKIILKYGSCTLRLKGMDPFNVLIRSIIGQQVSLKAAQSIRDRVALAANCQHVFLPKKLSKLNIDILRSCGLSHNKSKSIFAISESSAKGDLDFNKLRTLSDDDVIKTLLPLRGVGPWTAEMFLIFAFGRLDVLSTTDLGLRRGAEIAYAFARWENPRPSIEEFKELAETWKPYRTVASWYLWKVASS